MSTNVMHVNWTYSHGLEKPQFWNYDIVYQFLPPDSLSEKQYYQTM